jgi:hypothetical protein
MLWDALLPHVAAFRDELAQLPIGDPAEAAQHEEYRKLFCLLNTLKGAADTSFILGGRGFADVTPWAHAGALIATGVTTVLEQSGAGPLGFSAPGPVCRVTAKLVSKFTGFGEKSPNAISLLLRNLKSSDERFGPKWQ